MNEVVYIAGPMSGIEDYNRPAFMEAERVLRTRGFIVLNPAILPTDLPSEAYMPICMAMITQADIVFMLPGWETSNGAAIERQYALYQGKLVYSY